MSSVIISGLHLSPELFLVLLHPDPRTAMSGAQPYLFFSYVRT